MIFSCIQNESVLKPWYACRLLDTSLTAYQHWLKPKTQTTSMLLQSIQEIVEDFPRYGYRRVTKALPQKGVTANHKRVLQTMKENGLTPKKRRFRICTTNSNHGYPVHSNRIKGLTVTHLNQVWVSDITYVFLANGKAVYLATVLDRYSRKCIGWQLSRNIDAQLCLDALHGALEERKDFDLTGVIHHSDQGVQYASHEYVAVLEQHGILASMSRKGNPYDNAHAESFFKTVKYEEVYMNEYASFQDAYQNIQQFIEEVYNTKRLHSAIGYLPPAEFEQKILKGVVA